MFKSYSHLNADSWWCFLMNILRPALPLHRLPVSFSLSLPLSASTQIMKTFSPRPRSIREWNIKMCNRSASLCCCCCHHFCRSRIIFRQQECWGLLGKSWTMAVYSNWNSSTSFMTKIETRVKWSFKIVGEGDELEIIKLCPEFCECFGFPKTSCL